MASTKFSELLTPREVQDRFGLSAKWLANLRYMRKGPPYIKLGGKKVLYDPEDVSAWIERNSIKVDGEK